MRSRPNPPTLTSLFGRLCMVLAIAGAPDAIDLSAEPWAPDSLRPDVPLERQLTAGETHAYRLDLTEDSVWRVSVEQFGVDIELTLVPEDGERIVIDSPLDRAGLESLLVRPKTADGFEVEVFEVEVHARERAAPPGRYRIFLAKLDDATALDRERLTAETARMEAARYYAADRRRDALASYLQAADDWRRLGRPADEARALYCAAVLYRVVGETKSALELNREVLTRWQALGDSYWEAATQNETGLSQLTLGMMDAARTSFENALELRQAIQDSYGEINSRSNLCLALLHQGQLRQGLSCYLEITQTLDEAREPQFAATMHTNIGWTSDRLGEPAQAIEHYEQALSLNRLAGDLKSEAKTLNNLGWIRHASGQVEEALTRYERALRIFRQLEDVRWQSTVLHNLGVAYGALGEPARALSFLDQALPLRRQAGYRRGEAATLNHLGTIQRRRGEPHEALAFHRQAFEIAEDLGDPRQQAITLQMSAAARADAGEPRLALKDSEQALQLLRQVEDRPREASALHLIGELKASLGDPESAIASLTQALALRRTIRDRPREAETLTAIAQVEHDLGRTARALAHIESALERIEGLRTQVSDVDLRATFQSTHRQTYELHIDLLMTLHSLHPERGYPQQALEASERARARALLDLLGETGRDLRRGVDPELLARRSDLEWRLTAKATRQTEVLGRDDSEEEAAALTREFDTLLHQLERVEADIRRNHPRYADLTRPSTLRVDEIQTLLDPETVLLEYALGEGRSFLWWVTPDEIAVHELPSRAQIETLARRLHQQWSTVDVRERRQQAATAADLSRMLLTPIVDRLVDQRLAVVGDGALHYLPFAALPGADPTEPLLTRHEVVHLPSATVLATLRREIANRPPAPHRLAVVADPIFDPNDPRLATSVAESSVAETSSGGKTPPSKTLPSELRGSTPNRPSFRRLLGSGREAHSIAALAPPDEVMLALGFAANRQQVLGDRLRPYRIVHFATHGVIDAQTPRLSGLVLSLFDPQGRPQEGFLRLQDLYDLELASDLVVLSGCQTALGREIRGEGLVGLTRGFMYAGAPRVVASLWRVEDRATAELMTRFHRSMAADGLRPAAALRAAQLSLRQERRWKDPYYWAGFVLVGEWQAAAKPRVRTSHSGWDTEPQRSTISNKKQATATP